MFVRLWFFLLETYKKAKFRVACFLDDHTHLCWASLVLWSIGNIRFYQIERHKIDCDYCGKYSTKEVD